MNTTDPLEQLAHNEVPPVPEHFERRLHQRVNRQLLATHLLDLLLRGLPFAVQHFAAALGELLHVTLVGEDPASQRRRRRKNRRKGTPKDRGPTGDGS